ncbi:hypothetical protein DCAR_0521822 [Daucus carota subsp. sativus]|uniref:C2H2-type domain-containing protein n=1 Tax=Daucus carota subsp. sativus TaxID=79200 RepID=A0AAF0X6T7_DAUCS|nr:hypothetical protein DCAR_0521822 [Daucus carota subsp. sativus]
MSLLMVEEEEHNAQQHEAREGDPVAMSTPSNILKGKRTKRQRPQSPLPFSVAPANSSSNNAGGDYVTSTTTSDEDSAGPGTTEEEEDMAKCLLLLAQGGPKNDSHFGLVPYKFTSKKYLETSTSTNGKTGIYVYQCKTCNRTFPSFQALGGHRASHRKPKNVNAALENKPRLIISDEDEDQPPPFKRSFSASSLSLQLTTRPNVPFTNADYNKYSPRVHECAICGTEFSSGQALGGHMRRHRGGAPVNRSNATATTTNTSTKTLPLLPFCPNPISAIDPIDYHQETKKLKTSSPVNLSLDLNLPAATEDENKHHKQNLESPSYSFSSQQQNPQQQQQQQPQQQQKQTSLVLAAAPTLVDCQH